MLQSAAEPAHIDLGLTKGAKQHGHRESVETHEARRQVARAMKVLRHDLYAPAFSTHLPRSA